MSFPSGEQYFIDSVRNGLRSLPEDQRAPHAVEVQGFVGQEATHRRIHGLFNDHLKRQGYINIIEEIQVERVKVGAALDPRAHVAATAASEHLTALFADWMLRHPEALAGAEPRLKTMWLWHCAEETEHRSTAFDIYKAAGGNELWRIGMFRAVTKDYFVNIAKQTVHILWRNGGLFKPSTWLSAYRLLFKRDGLIRGNRALWRDYLRPDFHPSQHDGSHSERWLRDNAHQFSVVGPSS